MHGTSREEDCSSRCKSRQTYRLREDFLTDAIASNRASHSINWTPEMTDARPGRRYRFGVFEVDSTTGELRRNGLRVKLHSQPFQVL